MTSTVVIGAGYGDEGKGLITDFEVRRLQADTVCRFNGGAQAGHTVHSGDKRHVFGHLGAGTFAGASTYLGSRFIVNPMVLLKELESFSTRITCHPKARVTTVYDMIVNALIEEQRGVNRHGSCGMGINETVTRHDVLPLTMEHLATDSYKTVLEIVRKIRDEYLPARLKILGITKISEEYAKTLSADPMTVTNRLIEAGTNIQLLRRRTSTAPIVFEGAQGLQLDEFLGVFPHVTRSMTGLPYAIIAAEELGVKSLQPTYITRAYQTRHGAGKLSHEGIGVAPPDSTNVPNPWQGTLRYAPLNVQALHRFIGADIRRGAILAQAHGIELKYPTFALTCLDQLGPKVWVVDRRGILMEISSEYLPQYLCSELSDLVRLSHLSRGPAATDVVYKPA